MHAPERSPTKSDPNTAQSIIDGHWHWTLIGDDLCFLRGPGCAGEKQLEEVLGDVW